MYESNIRYVNLNLYSIFNSIFYYTKIKIKIHYCKGKPGKITTVDKYQGQQNDYILLSLVRTLSVGHLRDIRRLVVAMSRARLGLYVFGRQNLFENCFELAPIFNQLVRTSECKLELFTGEQFPSTSRLSSDSIPSNNVLRVEDVTAMGVLVYQMVQQIQQQSSSS